MEIFIGLLICMLLLGVFILSATPKLSSDRRNMKQLFDINIVDPGKVIGEGIFFGASPFRYARLSHKELQVSFFTLDKPLSRELVILPNEMRTYLALWVEHFDRKSPIWRPTGNRSIDMLLSEGIFIWLRGSAAVVIFPPQTPLLSHSEVLSRVALLRDFARGLESPVA